MTGKTADVLLVGPGREADSRVLAKDGVTSLTIPTCVDALARISRSRTRVVVLPVAEVAGRESAAIRAIRAAGADVLLTLPPHRNESPREIAAFGADDALREPYLPGALRDRVRRLLRRSEGIASGAASARLTPVIGPEAASSPHHATLRPAEPKPEPEPARKTFLLIIYMG